VLIVLALAQLLLRRQERIHGLVPFTGLVAAIALGVVILELRDDLAHPIAAKLASIWVFAELVLFVLVGAQLNLTVAWGSGSVSLFADSIDFLEDALVNLLIVFALGWPRIWRARLGFVLAAVRSARNDALANIAIVAASLITSLWLSGWPDLIVGLGIVILNADAAKAVIEEARNEHREPQP
jgi:Co/Zn/Cd efflux system component